MRACLASLRRHQLGRRTISRNIEVLDTTQDRVATVLPATDSLDAAESLACQLDGDPEPRPDTRRLLRALHALRQIDRAVVTPAIDLGAIDGIQASRTSSA
jgi:hypothetical protein